MIKITPRAAAQIRTAAEHSQASGLVLRVAAQRGDDSSINYLMGFDEAKNDDVRSETDDATVVYSPDDAPLLQGATLDYVELESGQSDFIFLNPNDPHYVPPQEN